MAYDSEAALLVATYGVPLLAYLCGVSPQEMNARLEGESQLTPRAESAWTQILVPLAESATAETAQQPGMPNSFALRFLGHFDERSGTSGGNHIRQLATADPRSTAVPPPFDVTSDPVKAATFKLACEVYPALLVPQSDSWSPRHLLTFHYPARNELDDALLLDPALASLFPEDDPGMGRRGQISSNLGRSWTSQSIMFADIVIEAAWSAATMRAETPSVVDLVDAVDSHIDVIRAATSPGGAEVRALLVFTGVTMADTSQVETPWGVLRSLTAAERSWAPTAIAGDLSSFDDQGNQITISLAGEIMLETQLPYLLVSRVFDPTEDVMAHTLRTDGLDSLVRTIEGVRLATLLALPEQNGDWPTARLAWQWIADPLALTSISWADTSRPPFFAPRLLSDDEFHDIGEWTHRIEAGWNPPINIAVRRTLSAAHSRTDFSDRLVDAVIAWENLFGTTEGEPRLRVTAAMAWLLGTDAASRRHLHSELKVLYDARSKVVHGARFDERQMIERGNAALGYAVQCLASLFRDRPDVLAASSGADRSLDLLLEL